MSIQKITKCHVLRILFILACFVPIGFGGTTGCTGPSTGQKPTIKQGCQEDKDCPKAQRCVAKVCSQEGASSGKSCTKDEDCPQKSLCESNRCQPDPHQSDDSPGPSKEESSQPTTGNRLPCDQETGRYRNVPAYSNCGNRSRAGSCRGCSSNCCGYKWQCVEYIERFYKVVFGFCSMRGSGNANQIHNNRSHYCTKKLLRFENGGSEPPRPDDIISWSGGRYGHIGIIREVGADYIVIIHQNFTDTKKDAATRLVMTVSENNGSKTYHVHSILRNGRTIGWMRHPDAKPQPPPVSRPELIAPGDLSTFRSGENIHFSWKQVNASLMHTYKVRYLETMKVVAEEPVQGKTSVSKSFAEPGRYRWTVYTPGQCKDNQCAAPARIFSIQKSSSCSAPKRQCGNVCVDPGNDKNHCGQCNRQCASNEDCINGSCRAKSTPCTGSEVRCPSGKCVDTSNDNDNCGSCGRKCSPSEYCSNSVCKSKSTPCRGAEIKCGGVCRDINSDNSHCGRCHNQCPSGQSCQNGRCQCSSGQSYCNNQCINTSNNNAHCGQCQKQCPSGQNCSNGTCSCPSGQKYCSNRCLSTSSDVNNCGSCGRKCSSNEYCSSGVCKSKSVPCQGAEVKCNNVCRNTSNDSNHCGRCHNQCPSGQSCQSGQCKCSSGQSYCGSQCTNTSNNNNHCGRCNNQCPSGQSCQNGQCQCSSGQSYCSNQCVNTTNNSSHCGRCNNRCSSGQYCQNGRCQCSSGKKYCGGGCRECCSSSDCGSGKTCSNYRCVNATPRVTGMSCTSYGKGQSASCTLTGVNFSKASSAWVSCLQISSQSRQSDNSWKLYGKWVCNCSTANRLEANVTGSSGNYTSSRSLSGSCSPQVYSVTPTTAYLNRETMFTVRGVNLPSSLAAWIDSCAGLRYGSRQSTRAIFYCKPSYSRGSKKGVIKTQSGGTLLKTFYIQIR